MIWVLFNTAIVIGAILQVAFLFREKLFLPKRILVLGLILLVSVITFLPGALTYLLSVFSSPHPLSLTKSTDGLRALAFLFVFSSFVAIVFREDLLPDVNESSVLLWMVVFWLINISFVPGFSFELGYAKLFLGMSVLTLLLVVIPQKLFPFERGLIYIWYLLMLIWSIFQTSIDPLLHYQGILYIKSSMSFFELIFSAMLTSYVAIHLVNLLYLLPIPIGQDPFERIRKMKEHYLVLADKYKTLSQHPFVVVSFGFFMVMLFALNHDFQLIEPHWLLYIYMASIPLVDRFVLQSKA